MRKTHQLYHTLQESRLECAVLRSEAHRLRRDNSELKTALEAVQRELEASKEQYARLMLRWNSSHMKQTEETYEREIRRLLALVAESAPASVEVICRDARQYESLSLARAGVKL